MFAFPHQVLMAFRLSKAQLKGLHAALSDSETDDGTHFNEDLVEEHATLILSRDGELYLSICDDDFADMITSEKAHGKSHVVQGIKLIAQGIKL